MSLHTVIIKACKIEVLGLLSLLFLTEAFAMYVKGYIHFRTFKLYYRIISNFYHCK